MARATSTPFVAREEQVDALEDALARAARGEPSAVLLAGDAGVGKTRLLRHVERRARAQGARVVVSHCVDLGEIGVPYLPFADALVQLRELAAAEVDAVVAARPALARLLPGARTGPVGDDQLAQLQLFDGVVDALGVVGGPGRPLLLVVEDAHWADASSRDLLRFVVSRLRDQHVLVVVSYRTDDLHRRHPWRPLAVELARNPRVERLGLEPFTPDELRVFAAAVAGRPLPEADLRGVAERSEGNAYFAQELIEAGVGSELPWSLAEVVRARLDVLDPAAQQVVRVASAAGRRVSEPLLRAALAADGSTLLAAPGAVDAALREAVAQQMLVGEQGAIAFRHALLAEAVYGDLLPGEQSALHRAYLVALTDDPALGRPSQLALHALCAPDLPVALAASREAADEAHRLLAPAEELRHLEVVLRLWDAVAPDDDRVPVLLAASAAASAAGQIERAAQLTRAAVDATADDPPRQAALRCDLARRLIDLERVREAFDEASAAVAGLSEPSAARAWALATVARAALNLERDAAARQAAEAAVEVARQVDAADAESDAMTTLAVLDADDPERAARLLLEALETVRRASDVVTEMRVRYNLVTDLFGAGDVEGAGALARESVERAHEAGLPWQVHAVQLAMYAELVAYVQGDLRRRDPARGAPAEVADVLEAVSLYAAVARGDEDAIARGLALEPAWTRDGLIALVAGGTTVDALMRAERVDEALALSGRVVDFLGRVWWEHFLGAIWIAAVTLAGLADEAARRRVLGQDVGELEARGDALLERAETTAVRGRPRAGRLGPEGRAWLARARAEHARLRGHDDPALWRATLQELDYGYAYEIARVRARLAASLVGAGGDRAEASREAAAALAAAEQMGAVPLATAVRELVRRARLDVPGVRAPTSDVLTPREAEVLALVAQGLTNGQIGETLFISTKTASVHVSNLLAKLGASGRAEAVAVAHRRGLMPGAGVGGRP